MDMFDELLEQDELVKKQRKRGFQEGKIEACQMILVDIVIENDDDTTTSYLISLYL